jgi:hypothetical protein
MTILFLLLNIFCAIVYVNTNPYVSLFNAFVAGLLVCSLVIDLEDNL